MGLDFGVCGGGQDPGDSLGPAVPAPGALRRADGGTFWDTLQLPPRHRLQPPRPRVLLRGRGEQRGPRGRCHPLDAAGPCLVGGGMDSSPPPQLPPASAAGGPWGALKVLDLGCCLICSGGSCGGAGEVIWERGGGAARGLRCTPSPILLSALCSALHGLQCSAAAWCCTARPLHCTEHPLHCTARLLRASCAVQQCTEHPCTVLHCITTALHGCCTAQPLYSPHTALRSGSLHCIALHCPSL